jgi:hypothetical protein
MPSLIADAGHCTDCKEKHAFTGPDDIPSPSLIAT